MSKRKPFIAGALYALMLGLCLLSPGRVMADPPKDLVLSYDAASQTLSATIAHSSTFTGLHYIKQVIVKKNHELISKNDYTSQTGKTSFTYTYSVPAAANDLLEVTAVCNIQGSKTATLKVETRQN
jgi:hypothetical protein